MDFTIETNADFAMVLTFSDDQGGVLDLTGYTAKMQLKMINANVVVFELSDVNGRLILGGLNGTLTLTADKTDLLDLPDSIVEYDLLLTDSVNYSKRVLEGMVTLDNGVTK